MKKFNKNIPALGFYSPCEKNILEKNRVDLKLKSRPKIIYPKISDNF
jgi:hypothetical protein